MLVVCHLFQRQQQTGVLTFDLMVSPPGSDSLPTADGATELGMVYTLYCTYPLSALPPCEKAPLGTRARGRNPGSTTETKVKDQE